MGRGIYLSIEALVALLLLAGMLALPRGIQPEDFTALHVMQKQNDLVKAWLRERDFSGENLLGDFRSIFPGSCGKIEIDAVEIEIVNSNGCIAAKNESAVEAFYVRDDLSVGAIKLRVGY